MTVPSVPEHNMDSVEPQHGDITPHRDFTLVELYQRCYQGHLSLEEAWFQMPPHFAFSILSCQDFIKWWNGEDVVATPERRVPQDFQDFAIYAPRHSVEASLPYYAVLEPLQAVQLYIAHTPLYCRPKDSEVEWQEAKHLSFTTPDFSTTEYATQESRVYTTYVTEGEEFTRQNAEYLAYKHRAKHDNVMYKTEHGYTLHLNEEAMQVIREVMHNTNLLDWQSRGVYDILNQIDRAMRNSVAQPTPAVYEAQGEVYAKLSYEVARTLFAELGSTSAGSLTMPIYEGLEDLLR